MVDEVDTIEKTEETTAEAPAKKPAVPREPKYAPTSVIKLLADKEGKQYGPENNPKKVGSATATRFEKYFDGMTVEQAKEAGLYGDLSYDAAHNFIEII